MMVRCLVMVAAIGFGQQSVFGQVPQVPVASGDSVTTLVVAPSVSADSGGAVAPSFSEKAPLALPFLGSKAALRVFALESCRSAFLELQSPGMANPSWANGVGWSSPLKESDLLHQFNSMEITVSMVNVEDYVHASGRLCNESGRALFKAESWAKPESVKGGGYELPKMWFWFTMETVVPIKVDRSITSARFRHVGADGRTVGEPFNLIVENGYVDFRSDLAGQGLLELWDRNGNQSVYDLRNGGVQVSVNEVHYPGSQSTVDGLYTFTNPPEITWEAWSWNGIGRNPAFEVTITISGWVPVKVHSNEGAVAIGYKVKAMGQTNWDTYPVVAPSTIGLIPLVPGVWYIIPVWNESEFAEPEPQVPQVPIFIGGGKG